MASRAKRLLVVGLVIAAAAGGGYLYVKRNATPEGGPLVLYGNVDVREVDLGFNVAGRVEAMLVEEGEPVEKGERLARLEAERYKAELDAAKGQVAAQKAALDRLLAGSRPEEIRQARANVAAIEAELKDARATLVRTGKLVPQGFASRQKLDSDRARVGNLEGALRAAKQTLTLAIKGPRKEDIAEARAKLKTAEADLAFALERFNDTELYARARGTVLTRVVEPGAVVLANSPVYTMALTDPVFVRTYVNEVNLGRVHPGQVAAIYTDAAPGEAYAGWVGFISPIAEFTPKTVETPELRTSLVYRMRVYVRNPDLRIRQGMPVTVKFEGAEGAAAAPKKVGWWERLRALVGRIIP